MFFRGMGFVVHVVLKEIFGGEMEKCTRRMEKIVKGFSRMGFVVHVVLRELFGTEMENLTGGWREL